LEGVLGNQRRSGQRDAKSARYVLRLEVEIDSFTIDLAAKQINPKVATANAGRGLRRVRGFHSRRALLKERFSRFARNESPSPDDNGPERPVRDHRVYFGPPEPNCATEIINAIR
jgi:hypothetical protein